MIRYRLFSALLLIGVMFSLWASPASAQVFCDWAQYVSDVSVPDGTAFQPGAAFTKTWRLMNAGTCTWSTSYKLVFAEGDALGAPASVNLPNQVLPGQTVDISVNMAAPAAAGHYRGFWKLSNEAGTPFGIGTSADGAFWVDINVVEINTAIYDFVANAPYAQWKSAAGALPYPGTSGDSRGYSFQLDSPRLEDNSVDTLPGLLVVPHQRYDGYIQGVYPEFLVQQGDRFQTIVNCEYGATGCYVTFRLDYLTSTGNQRTVWTWKEAYEGRYYRADIDLSRLAGQRVRFVLTILATGSPTPDRAIWGAPRIIRAGTTEPPAPAPTLTPLPGLTPTPTPFGEPPPLSPAPCERAAFVADITVPDGSLFSPGAAFTKTWRLRNSGSCAWQTSYNVVFYSGSQMDAPTVLRMPRIVVPGQTVDLTVNMVAPQQEGVYRGHWAIQNAGGGLFGIGRDGLMPFWVEIHVVGQPPQNTGYDFVVNACAAQWRSGAGQLECPTMEGNLGGFVIPLTAPKLEDGSIAGPGLLIAPHFKWNGFIQGFYPTFTVQPGDRFQATVGCEYTVKCNVVFRLDYMTATGSISSFWTWRELNEGRFYNANVDLTLLAGRSVRFILTVIADGSPVGDRVTWGSPQIVRSNVPPTITPSPTLTPTATPTPTPAPPPSNWLTFTNTRYGFQFMYPPEGQKENGSNDNFARIRLPFAPGTNLGEKYLDVNVAENVTVCRSPVAASSITNTSETVVINGLTFLKETGGDAGVGNIWEWIAYSTAQGTTCVSLSLVLHSTQPSNSATPPPVFDKAAESAVINTIVSTFSWPTLPPTSNWLTYTNSRYGFLVKYPPEGQITAQEDNHATITLPFAPGTNLRDKYVDIVVVENATTCRSPRTNPMTTSETVTINGLTFLKETGEEGAAGNYYHWIDYSVSQGSACVSLDFTLHSLNAGNFPTPPPVFDMAAETAVFQNIVSTFAWITQPPTNNWLTYSNSKYGFQFTYPPEGQVTSQDENHVTITLPFAPGTNLREKYLDAVVTENVATCQSPLATSSILQTTEPQTINGLSFLKQTGEDRGVGNIHQWIAYSTAQGSTCTSLDFVLHSLNPDNFPTPPPVFDMGAESAVFQNMVSTFAWPSPPSPPMTTVIAVVEALNSQNFEAAKAKMDQSFVIAHWQSQGTSYTPDAAIEQLRVNYFTANTHLTPDPQKDLNALLGGDPFSIMGLDPARSEALFVSGWGLDGRGEAILYFTRRPDDSQYWHSVLIAPSGFAATSGTGTYAVALVPRNDFLNIRSDAGVDYPVVGSFANDATDIVRTGPSRQAGGANWVEVRRLDGGTGWVNFNYLTEYKPSAAFCADTRIPPRIEQLKQSMNQSDGNLLASMVNAKHGAALGFWRDAPPIHYTTVSARSIFTDPSVYNWGTGPAAGPVPVSGTFAQVVQPDLAGVLNSNYQLSCDNPSYAGMFVDPWPYTNIHYYAVLKPPTPEIVFDWKVWLIGFEYVDGLPYLFGTIHYVWEP